MRVLGLLVFLLVLLVFGLAGADDVRTGRDYLQVRAEILSSAPDWAVRD